ncbi:hypothetical protein TSUD_93280 [Trifolium subterraneum]|uniref:Bromo domain-containing protein n=1 Tax=Trifolium subterraneum TaxID=3900 RepID=A0A2Z6MGU6_TRISU|nr:hypothetical protein TSUD_93280 [Trifolium subterraneum]
MASGPTDGDRERKRYSEGKVYRRKVFKGQKKNPNLRVTVASATVTTKDQNTPTTTITKDSKDTDNNNNNLTTTVKNINNHEAKDNVSAPQLVLSDDENLAQAEGVSRLEDGNTTTALKNVNNDEAKDHVLAPQLVVSEDGNLAQAEGVSRLEDGNTTTTVKNVNNDEAKDNVLAPQLAESSILEDENSNQIQPEDQNLAEEQVSLISRDGNSPQQQLEDQNLAQPQASSRTGDGSSPQQQLEDENLVLPQESLRTGDVCSPQQQLDDEHLAQTQVSLRTANGNSPQQQLKDQSLAQPQVSPKTVDGSSPQQQLEDENLVQPQESLRTGNGNSPQQQQQFEDPNLAHPLESSRTGDGNSPQQQYENGNSPQQQFENQNLAQPQESSRVGNGDSPQQQFENQNLAQTHVSSRMEDGNSPRTQNTTQKDGNSPQPQAQQDSRPEDGNSSQLEVDSRLEDGSLPQPELNSKLEDGSLISQQQDNSILEDGKSSQPQLNLRLEEGSSLQPLVNSTLEDQNMSQPLSHPVSDDLHNHQQAEPSNLDVQLEDDRPMSPIHRQGAISDDLYSHQQAEPSNPDVQRDNDGPSSPIHRHGAVPSTGYRQSANVTVEPSLEDRIRINLAMKSKQEKQEIQWKLESELDVVRSLVKRIEVKQGHVGVYGNSNVVLGGGISNGVGAKRAHSEVASAGVSRQPTRPLHQLSFPMYQNREGVRETVEKEKRMPKANQFYHNSDFLLAKDKFPPAESNKKSKLNWKKQGSGEMSPGFRMGSKFFKSCSSLLEKLMKHKHGWVFNSPVDVEALGLHDYFTIITHPMDLGTVKTRLNKNWYKSPKEFAEDVRLTFHNAMTYNPKGQDVHVMAEHLSKIFEDRWAIIESDYNREMRYGMEYGAPSPLSRRVPAFTPPPPLDMRRVLDRSESLARTPRSMNNTPSSRTPAPKKPKAKDPNKRDMTYDEKQKLSTNLQSLPPEKLDAIVQIIKRRNLELNQHDDEIEVDIDSVDAETLWELDRFVTNYKKSLSKNKRRAELARARAEAMQNSIQRSQPPAMVEIPREPQADERNVPPSLPIQGGSQADNRSRSSSSSSSSSDSGSSSSDSDSDSSSASGSDGGSQGT